MIVIIDYGMGNLRNVQKAGEFLGKNLRVTDSPAIIKKAKKIIFPGVGNFKQAVKELKQRKIFDILIDRINEGVPFLGICLGMQLLLELSEEAPGVRGLGVIKGKVKKFDEHKIIVPHMGWNQAQSAKRIAHSGKNLFRGIPDKSYFYFAHSYYCDITEKGAALATTEYGINFSSACCKKNIWGVQFHPEKSQKLGLKLFDNFLTLC
ncbi:MAG: imidazole glycerol phosphate synthase subunit HisH [Candidatus Omnitrophica bacterium]|jgi:glutamine amidotransferase|nr:imidazole glycerol phosphate synthase subunit HisH [Candidatus Omnitrophota bacterium]